MDLNELNKTQLVYLTLLITFVVSIATGIVTVSLMKQLPKSVPQTINNVIQRTIEKVTTIASPTSTPSSTETSKDNTNESTSLIGDGNVLVPIYSESIPVATSSIDATKVTVETPKELGQGVIISDVGLILVDTSILTDKDKYRVVLNKKDFEASILIKYGNGFTVLKIISKPSVPDVTDTSTSDTPVVDKIQ